MGDTKLNIETTWLESGDTQFHRVIVFDAPTTIINATVLLRDTVAHTLYADLGLYENADYVFDSIMNTWFTNPTTRATIRVKEEEHFVMLKLHYDSN